MILKIINKLLKRKDNKLQKYLDLVIDYEIGDYINIEYYCKIQDRYKTISGDLYAFGDKGNISLKKYNDYININLIDSNKKLFKINNYDLEKRLDKMKKENEKLKAEKLKNESADFQEILNEYRKEFIKLQLENNQNYD